MGTPCIFQKECRQDLPAGRANTPWHRVELCIVRNHKAFIYPFRKRKKAGASHGTVNSFAQIGLHAPVEQGQPAI